MGNTWGPGDGLKRWEAAGIALLLFLLVGTVAQAVRRAWQSRASAAAARLAHSRRARHGAAKPLPVELLLARAVARATLHRPGGMVIANPRQLATTPYGTRYLGRQCRYFTSYASLVRRFGTDVVPRPPGRRGVLFLQGHGGNGLGLEAVAPLDTIRLPPGVPRPRRSTVGEMVALRRVLADIGSRWDLIVLGECNPRACLRSLTADIPTGPELFHSLQVAQWPAGQLCVVRNFREDLYLLGGRVVGREPYTPPASKASLARVVAPDVIGCQDSAEYPEESSMTDVFILTGRWTQKPARRKSRREIEPTRAMIRRADRLVRNALRVEQRAVLSARTARRRFIRLAAASAPRRRGPTP